MLSGDSGQLVEDLVEPLTKPWAGIANVERIFPRFFIGLGQVLEKFKSVRW